MDDGRKNRTPSFPWHLSSAGWWGGGPGGSRYLNIPSIFREFRGTVIPIKPWIRKTTVRLYRILNRMQLIWNQFTHTHRPIYVNKLILKLLVNICVITTISNKYLFLPTTALAWFEKHYVFFPLRLKTLEIDWMIDWLIVD